MMWTPTSAADIEEAAQRGDLEETAGFDGKADLPVPKKNSSLAVDVAAMATDGGTLLYGLGEDANKRLTVLSPITLAGAADRVDQIVSTSLVEVPYIRIREFPTDDDPTKGYLLVIVPQSSRAPHQVTVGGDLRFYGRAAKGNRILTEGEVARLYRRREEWEQDRSALLAEAVAQAPFPLQEEFGYLHGFVRPVAPDPGIWDRALAAVGGDRAELQRQLAEAAARPGSPSGYSPDLRSGVHWTPQGADEWRASSSSERNYRDPGHARYIVNVRMNVDGRGHLFCGRAADTLEQRNRKVIFEVIVAGNFAGFVASLGALYRLGGYHGHVDLGLALTGLRGAFSGTFLDPNRIYFWEGSSAFNADTYTRDARVAAAELEEPETLVRGMLRNLCEATTHRNDFDPLA